MPPTIVVNDGVTIYFVRGEVFDYVKQSITADDSSVHFAHTWSTDYIVVEKDRVTCYENTRQVLTIGLSEKRSVALAAELTAEGIRFW